MIGRPEAEQPHYGRHLTDVGYWQPWVRQALSQSGFDAHAEVEAGFRGSFPTFLVGDVVVKIFGPGFDGPDSRRVEAAVHQVLATEPTIPAPRVLAAGELTDDGEWAYLVFERVHGIAWRDADLNEGQRHAIAEQLAHHTRTVHLLPLPDAPRFQTNMIDELRRTAAQRSRLPSHLKAQIEGYLEDAETPTATWVHGDITEDHVYVDPDPHRRHLLIGIIDWGDALRAPPGYELNALFAGAFKGDTKLLRTYLDAYQWLVDPTSFPKRMLQSMLTFQFDAFDGIAIPTDAETLDDLADALFPAALFADRPDL